MTTAHVDPAPQERREPVAGLPNAILIERGWEALRTVEDPEIPALTLVDLGVIRFVRQDSAGRLEVGLSPTYTGCPATAIIRRMVEEALASAELDVTCTTVLSPPWSSDWITPEGRRKLHEYGIVPPQAAAASSMRDVMRGDRPLACPHCGSIDTERVNEFGSTPCKALHRCRACLEPFENFKCI